MLAVVLFAVLLSAQSVTFPTPEQVSEPSPVAWVTRPSPTPDDFPPMAAQLGLSGKAVIACEANPQGVPVNCYSLSSAPAHLGFDRAAINVVQRGRVTPATQGNTEARPIMVTIPFRSRADEERPEWKGPEPTAAQLNAGRQFAVRIISSRPPIAERLNRSWRMDRLPAEQRQALVAWITELAPSREQEITDTSIAAARVLAVHGADIWPRERPENFPQWQSDMERAHPHDRNTVMSEIARRYCATFSCVTD